MKIKHPEIDFNYIETEQELSDLLSEFLRCKPRYLAIDTESYPLLQYGEAATGLDPHTSRVRLISLYWKGIDPTVIDCSKVPKSLVVNLLEAFQKADTQCIAHNAMHDIKAIRASFGMTLDMRCTLVALSTLAVSTGWKAALFRGKGLKDMARDFFSIHLKKDLGNSDWSNQTLSKDQLAYSALDVAAPKDSGVKSILIEGYKTIKAICTEELDEESVFLLDQDMVPILADMAYEGLPMNRKLIDLSLFSIEPLINDNMLELCRALNIKVESRLKLVDGEFVARVKIPPHSAKLLNNNKELVKRVAEATKHSGVYITDLQADTLLSFMKELEENSEDMDGEENPYSQIDRSIEDDIELIKVLLDYKKYSKMRSELEKYRDNLNPATGNLHSGTSVIGTSTARMSSSGFGKARINLQQIGTLPFKVEYEDYSILFETKNPINDDSRRVQQ